MPYLPADPPLTPRDLLHLTRRTEPKLDSWLPSGRSSFFGSGRAALWGALRGLGVGRDAEVLLPSYLCESVVSPVLAVGAQPRFYPIGRDLRPDLAALDRSIGPATRAVVLIHYLGFPGPVDEVRQLCDARGLLLIEDCAHALYSRRGDRLLGSWGDAAVFSPWKTLPLPDGGVLTLAGADPALEAPANPPSWAATARRLLYRSIGTAEAALGWSPRLRLLRHPRLRRNLHRQTSGAPVRIRAGSPISWRMLQTAPASLVVARRRENYRRLLAATRRLEWGRPIFDGLPAGVCPLGLPLVVEDRDRWRDRLLAGGVNVRTYWEHLPPIVDLERFPDARWVRDRILVLPVHQGLSPGGIDWLAAKLSAGSRRSSATPAKRVRMYADG
jgi:perosamine synthetase